MDKKATIYEVARQVGVSTATVSRVLNESPRVSDKTKRKVLEVMKEIGYAPQFTARKLAKGTSQLLAVVVPSFTTPYYNEVLKGIKDEIAKTDLDMMLYNTGSKNPEAGLTDFFHRGIADALLLLSISIPKTIHDRLLGSSTHTVLVNSEHSEYNYFQVDDYLGGKLAAEHLVEKGYKSIGIIAPKTIKGSTKRTRGFRDGLRAHGLDIEEQFFVRGKSGKHAGFSEESGFEAIKKLEKLGRFPDALFCLNDTLAMGAMYALNRLGMKVPDDVAIVGYDNIKMSKYFDLTTVDQKMYTIGVNSIQRLSQLINNGGDSTLMQETISPQLVERGSTGT